MTTDRFNENASYALASNGDNTLLILATDRGRDVWIDAYLFKDGEVIVEPVSGWLVTGGQGRRAALDYMIFCLAHDIYNVYSLRDQTIPISEAIRLTEEHGSERIAALYKTWRYPTGGK